MLSVRWSSKKIEVVSIVVLVLIWTMHGTGVLVPETGFDAVWYHLPIAQRVIETGGLAYMPELYQSVNPLASDLFFFLGYMFMGELGAKLVAFSFGLSLVAASYALSRQYMDRAWSLYAAIIVSLFQVVAWQASSFYVDVAKAMWEVVALVVLLHAHRRRSSVLVTTAGIAFGLSLGTKAFSILLLPAFLVIVWLLSANKIRDALYFLVSSVVVSLPWYLRSYYYTGDAWHSVSIHVAKLAEIGGESSLLMYVTTRLVTLPYSLVVQLSTTADYTTPLIIILLPCLVLCWRLIASDKRLQALLVFSASQWLVWWFVPPTSSRYALSGFIVLLILLMKSSQYLSDRNKALSSSLLMTMILVTGVLALPRVAVAARNMRYILGQQAKQEYLEQFLDGNVDQHLCSWHDLPCSKL